MCHELSTNVPANHLLLRTLRPVKGNEKSFLIEIILKEIKGKMTNLFQRDITTFNRLERVQGHNLL